MIRGVSGDRWREAGALFHALVELNEASRREQLARVADSDPELGMMVESLLAGDAIADEALPAPGFGLPSVSGVGSTDTFGLEGKTVGRFRVIERVAWGGMGVVYRAEDLRLGRNVALKFPLLDRDVSEIARVLSLREARAAGALDHPNVCPIYDVGESAQGAFLLMPLYSGETLKEHITRVGPMPASEALDVLQQVAAGLACAHAAGIVHCDVKPGNIMLLPDGVVKILDFGLARAGSVDSAVSSGAIGTVAYMAPEQIRNEPVDARTDLWALGVTLYEMLCGSRPFVGEDASEIARAVVESKPTSLAARGVFLPSEVQDLVSALLAPERDARPQTASALIGAISTARSAMDRSVRRREMRRRYVVVGFAAAAIAIVASVLWLRPAPTLISAHKLAPFDAAVLADVQVTGPDSNDAPVFTSIVRREFEDSRAVRLMSDRDVRSALERMRRPGKTPVADSVARQIALRENARVVLSSRVLPLGSGYLVAVRLIDAESGNELTASTKRATNAEKLPETLSWASREVRRAIGESPRGANAPASRRKKPLTTTSLEVARLLWANTGTRSASQKLADTRAALRLDTAFAYGWMSLGNMLQWTNYRSALVDTAFKTAYALRDGVTLMERAQISGMYWATLQRNRRSALAEANQAIALDSAMYGAVPLNMTVWLNDSRQFEETERFGRRIERWPTVGPSVASAVVAAQIALGKYAAAESTIARRRAARPKDQALDLELLIALSALRFDSAETLLTRAQPNRATGDWPALHRLRGRLAEAHRAEFSQDSARAASAAAAGARFDSMPGRWLTLAREALWLRHDSTAAVTALDEQWGSARLIHDTQDRIEGIQAAGLYAAAGQWKKGDSLLAFYRRGADTLVKRVVYEYALAAQAEIALAQRNFTEAMRLFRASDFAADGLPVSPCSVCVLPDLARVAERAGWSDSARGFWEDYVHRPAVARLSTDQWFLRTAYGRLALLADKRGDATHAATYRAALVALRAPNVGSESVAQPNNGNRR